MLYNTLKCLQDLRRARDKYKNFTTLLYYTSPKSTKLKILLVKIKHQLNQANLFVFKVWCVKDSTNSFQTQEFFELVHIMYAYLQHTQSLCQIHVQ